MKKIMAVVVTVVLSASVLAGCGGQAPASTSSTTAAATTAATQPAATTAAPTQAAPTSQFKDGTYKVSYDNLDSHGYKAFVELTIAGGKITAATYDSVDKDGKLKSQNADYEKAMVAKVKIGPAEYSVQLPKSLVEKQDPAVVDIVTGATESSKDFQKLATAALENAKAGTAESTLPQPDPAK